MILEIVISGLIILGAATLLYRNIKKKASGGCDCSHCSRSCSMNRGDPR